MEDIEQIDIPMAEILFQQGSNNRVYNGDYRVDFSSIPDNRTKLLEMLPSNAPFYKKGDFKELFIDTIKDIATKARKIYKRTWNPFDIKLDFYKVIDSKTDFTIDTLSSFGFFFSNNFIQTWEPNEVFYHLSLTYNHLKKDYLPSVIITHQLYFTALYLMMTGNITPRIFRLSKKGDYIVRWFAIKGNNKVKEIVEGLESLIPDNYLNEYFKAITLKYESDFLLSEFLTSLINIMCIKNDDAICKFIFAPKPLKFKKNEKVIPYEIKIWTDTLFLKTLNYKYIVKINDNGNGLFQLEIAFSTGKETISLQNIVEHSEIQKLQQDAIYNFALLNGYIKQNFDVQKENTLTFEELTDFLLHRVPILKNIGIEIMLPKSMHGIIRPRLTMRIKSQNNNVQSYLHIKDILEFDWRIALGDNLVSYKKFMELAKNADGLIKIKENYFYIDMADIKRIKRIISGKYKDGNLRILQSAIMGMTFENDDVVLDDNAKILISKLKDENEIDVPESINATLRPYQKRGFNWLYRNSKLGFGSILADDMGLGKTLQTITFLQKIKDDGLLSEKKILIIAPTGLIYNWQSEIKRFAPKLTSFIYYGQDRNLEMFDSDILISTYGVLRLDCEKLNTLKWAIMVIDEAQNIKNRTTAQAQSAFSICADIHIALSGTPVENNLSEFWSIMNFANNGYFGTPKHFAENFANPIQNSNDIECADKLKKISAPFMLRRLKTDKNVIVDLPDKIEKNISINLKPNQAVLYNRVVEATMLLIEKIDKGDHNSEFERNGLVLQLVLSLKQICNHPALYLKNLDRSSELSGKSEMLLPLVQSIVENGQKVLIFTQFKQMGDIISEMFRTELSLNPLFLHGGCSIVERNKMVEQFQNDDNAKVFILSLKAAGTGLNLTAASHIIHFDLWWNPAVESQATDRAYRIGQHQNVIVYRFVTANTFEEKIDNIIQNKKHLADIAIATGESWIGKLSDEELKELFSLL
ncbi:MAG: DEAD/DEAH box helicase [Bacteroidales bacterium]|nr:DEAD/DEAH box helicase [Bacteroidales bacterium]